MSSSYIAAGQLITSVVQDIDERFSEEILCSMQHDEISAIVRRDWLISRLQYSVYEKHGVYKRKNSHKQWLAVSASHVRLPPVRHARARAFSYGSPRTEASQTWHKFRPAPGHLRSYCPPTRDETCGRDRRRPAATRTHRLRLHSMHRTPQPVESIEPSTRHRQHLRLRTTPPRRWRVVATHEPSQQKESLMK